MRKIAVAAVAVALGAGLTMSPAAAASVDQGGATATPSAAKKPCVPGKVTGGIEWDTSDPTALLMRPWASVTNCAGTIKSLRVTVSMLDPDEDYSVVSTETFTGRVARPSGTQRVSGYVAVEHWYVDVVTLEDPYTGSSNQWMNCEYDRNGRSVYDRTFLLKVEALTGSGKVASRAFTERTVACGDIATAK